MTTTTLTSQTFSPVGVAACIRLANKYIAENYDGHMSESDVSNWAAKTNYQRRFISWLPKLAATVPLCPEIKAKVDFDQNVINSFLAENGFDKISLQDPPPGLDDNLGFAVAAIIDNLLKWSHPAGLRMIGQYTAFRLHQSLVSFVQIPDQLQPTIKVSTDQGDLVVITPSNEVLCPVSMLELASAGFSEISPVMGFKGCVVPMVSYNEAPDVSWLVDIFEMTHPNGHYIQQAVQQIKFKMNQYGLRDQSATAMYIGGSGCTSEDVRRDYVVNRPFLLSIHRAGYQTPIFIGHFFPDSWKDPGDLNAK